MDNLSTINTYAFVLGRERELCLAELRATLVRFGFYFGDFSVADNIAFINIANTDNGLTELTNNESGKKEQAILDAKFVDLMKVLGGTIKIFRIIEPMSDKIKPVLESYIENNLKKDGKFNFGLSSYSVKFDQRRLNSLGLEMKKDFKGKFSSRFVELREGKEVSTILSLKSKLVEDGFEFGLFNESIGILVATTNPVGWSVRDYEKPAGDKYSGMLPPKLARIMINLALGQIDKRQQTTENNSKNEADVGSPSTVDSCLIVDPFCGSGNVVLEAMMLGCDVFGSDVSEKAVNDTKENVEWLFECRKWRRPEGRALPGGNAEGGKNIEKPNIIQADATSADLISSIESYKLKIINYDCMTVVCEPYLGEPKKFMPTLKAAKGEYAKVRELYFSFLANFANFKSYNPVFCIVFPLVETIEGKRFSLYRDCVDEIKKIGYTELQSPLIYGRDYQVVKREILLLTL